jgi:DNA-binding MarR family transcriptional regulator
MKKTIIREILAALRVIDADLERVDELAAARLGVNLTDFRCLDVLSRGEPMTAGQLAAEAGLTTGAATALIDRLERAGYVERRSDRGDRRRVLVTPTKRAMDTVWPLFEGIVAGSTAVLSAYSLSDLRVILRFLEENKRAIRMKLGELERSTSPRRRG